MSTQELSALTIALVFGIPATFGVRRVVRAATPTLDKPTGIDQVTWSNLVARTSGGPWIGGLELYLAIAAFSLGGETLVAGWLAFKLASKWEVWRNVVQVPSKLEEIPDLQWYGIRSAIGNYVLVRFWVGTLANVLGGLAAAVAGKALVRLLW